MQYSGKDLLSILRAQKEPVGIKSDTRMLVAILSRDEAVELAETGLYFGVGHCRRIRFLRRANQTATLNSGSSTTRRIRNDAGLIIAARPFVEHRPLPSVGAPMQVPGGRFGRPPATTGQSLARPSSLNCKIPPSGSPQGHRARRGGLRPITYKEAHMLATPEQTNVPSPGLESENINLALREHVAKTTDWLYAEHARDLHEWADRFNERLNLKLPTPAIAIAKLRRGRLGQYRQGRNDFGLRHEVIIDENHLLSSTYPQVLATLVHELFHEWQELRGRPSRGNHHNVEFRERIKHVGIIVDARGVNLGYQRGAFTAILESLNIDTSSLMLPDYGSLRRRTRAKLVGTSKLKLWTCGCTKIRAAVTVAARCLRCGGLFEFADGGPPRLQE